MSSSDQMKQDRPPKSENNKSNRSPLRTRQTVETLAISDKSAEDQLDMHGENASAVTDGVGGTTSCSPLEDLRKSDRKIPAHWALARLGDIAKTTSGGTPRRDRPEFYTGNIPWVKSGELGDSVVYETAEFITEEAIQSSSAKIFPKGTVCIALYGATVGKLGILGIDAATNQAVCAIFPPDELDTRFLYRFLESKRSELVEQGKGGAQPNISQSIIRDMQIPIPSVAEQRQIVAEIEKQFTRLEAGVAALRRVQANLKRYRASVLKAACEGTLVENEVNLARAEGRSIETGEQLLQRILAERRRGWVSRRVYIVPVEADIVKPSQLPKGWTWATVEQLSAFVQYGSSCKTNEDQSGIPVLRMGNIQVGSLMLDKLKYLPTDHEEFPDLLLQKGDLLFNRTNSAELVGKTAVFRGTPEQCSFASYLIRVRLSDGCIPDIVAYYINSVFGRAWINSCVSQQVGQANVNGTKLQALAIPLPPLAEQMRIATEVERRLSLVDELESIVLVSLRRATNLRQSILQREINGVY